MDNLTRAKKTQSFLFSDQLNSLIATHKQLMIKLVDMRQKTDEIQRQAFEKFAPYELNSEMAELLKNAGQIKIEIKCFNDLYQVSDQVTDLVYAECDRLYRKARLIDEFVPFGGCPSLILESKILEIESKIVNLYAEFVNENPDLFCGEYRLKLLENLGIKRLSFY